MEAQCLYRFVQGVNDSFYSHRHEFYEIFITVSGTVRHRINGHTIPLPEGSLVFIRPDDDHGYLYDGKKSDETAYINLTFTTETALQLFEYLSDGFPSKRLLTTPMPPTVILTASEKKRLIAQIGELNAVKWQDKKQLKLRMRVLLADIFSRYFSAYTPVSESDIPLWLSQLTDSMRLKENFTKGMEQMRNLSGKSREHISRCIKKYYGVSASEYINDLKTNYAANLLVNTNSEVIDVCFEAGFQNVSWFYTSFKKKYGVSPKKFRAEHNPHGINQVIF